MIILLNSGINVMTNESNLSRGLLKERIITEAFAAFTQNGIKNITMDDIANRLGISKRTLYETFTDKEDLLIACLTYQQGEMIEYSRQVLEESDNVMEVILKFYQKSIEIYHQTNRKFFEDMNKYPRVQELARVNREKNSKNTVDFFMKGVEQGLFRDDINFAVMHILVKEQINLLMNSDICNDFSFFEVYESIMIVFMRGISTDKGQKILDDFVTQYRTQQKN